MSQLNWQKSSYSEAGGDNCVNVAATPDRPHTLHLRESDAPEVVLTTSLRPLAAMLRSLQERPEFCA
jgi:hypothetical protein